MLLRGLSLRGLYGKNFMCFLQNLQQIEGKNPANKCLFRTLELEKTQK